MPPQGFQNILCPVDFSDISALGLRFANAIANCAGARLHVLYADQFLPPPYFTHDRLEQIRQQLKGAKLEAERTLTEFAGKTLGAAGAGVNVRVIEALPVDGILQAIDETSADLVAMGTHGRSGFNRLMLGSVTEHLLRVAPVPVLTVRPRDGGPEPFPAIRSVVCPVNESEVARTALGYAARLAHCFGAELTVLHAREPHGKDSISDLCAWVPAGVRSMCTVREMTRDGEAAEVILRAASELSCDVLVMGARYRTFFEGTIVGTTSIRVVRHAPCAVLTIPARS